VSSHSLMAEQGVIGACMIDPQAFWQVSDLLTGADFWDQRHRFLWGAFDQLAKASMPFDAVTVGDHLVTSGTAEGAGGVGYVLDLANTTPSSANVRAYAEIVLDKATERRVSDAGARISKLTGKESLIDAQAILGSVSDRLAAKTQSAKEAMAALVGIMQNQADREEGLLGVPFGFPMLDAMTAGMHGGELILVAGRPSMGKSLFAMQIAMHAAQAGFPAHIASLEMPTSQCMQRLVSALSSVPFDHVRDAKTIEEHEWAAITRAAADVSALPLYFDDDVYELQKILARIRQVHAAHGCRVAVIDYLSYMRMPKADTNALAVQEVTRELKALAKALKITVILVSQLNRGLEGRTEKRPILSDLRESGAIEQDADMVLMLYRDEYHNPDSTQKGFAELLIRKQRNGPTGMVPLRTRFDVQRFESAPDGLPLPVTKDSGKRGFSGFRSRKERADVDD